jgi:iron complex transport system permease protein
MTSIVFVLLIIHFSGTSQKNIVLAGLGINFIFSSLNTLLQYFSSPEAVYQVMFWTSGSLSLGTKETIMTILFVLVFSSIAIIPIKHDLGLIGFGKKQALSLGVNVTRVRVQVLIIAAFLASITVSIIGSIGFIGLIAPQISRLLHIENPEQLIPLSVSLGSCLLVLSDIASRTLNPPVILPLGAITSIIGVPFFLILIFLRGKSDD